MVESILVLTVKAGKYIVDWLTWLRVVSFEIDATVNIDGNFVKVMSAEGKY